MSISRQIISEFFCIRSCQSILNVFLIPVLLLGIMCTAKKDNNAPVKQSVEAVSKPDLIIFSHPPHKSSIKTKTRR